MLAHLARPTRRCSRPSAPTPPRWMRPRPAPGHRTCRLRQRAVCQSGGWPGRSSASCGNGCEPRAAPAAGADAAPAARTGRRHRGAAAAGRRPGRTGGVVGALRTAASTELPEQALRDAVAPHWHQPGELRARGFTANHRPTPEEPPHGPRPLPPRPATSGSPPIPARVRLGPRRSAGRGRSARTRPGGRHHRLAPPAQCRRHAQRQLRRLPRARGGGPATSSAATAPT